MKARTITSDLFAGLILIAVVSTAWAAAEGRLLGAVLDPDEKPVAGAKVEVRATDVKFEKTLKTNKKGKFNLLVLDATRDYEIRITAEGFRTLGWQPLDVQIGIGQEEFLLTPAPTDAGGGVAADALGEVEGTRKAVRIYNEGATAYNAGDLDLALAKFAEAVAEDPELVAGHLGLAGIHMEQKNYAEAAEAANAVLATEPDSVPALLLRYDALRAAGDTVQSAALLGRLVELEGGTATATRAFNEGVDALRKGDLPLAAERFGLAVRINPELTRAHGSLARVQLDLGKYEESVANADIVLGRDPGNADALSVKYEALKRLGRAEEAGATLDALTGVAPDAVAQAFYSQGESHFNAGDVDQAVAALQRTVQADPSHARAHYLLGLAYVNQSKPAEARGHFERFLELAPGDPEAETAKGMLEYLSQGD